MKRKHQPTYPKSLKSQLPKSLPSLRGQFRHRDRGIHIGRVKVK